MRHKYAKFKLKNLNIIFIVGSTISIIFFHNLHQIVVRLNILEDKGRTGYLRQQIFWITNGYLLQHSLKSQIFPRLDIEMQTTHTKSDTIMTRVVTNFVTMYTYM